MLLYLQVTATVLPMVQSVVLLLSSLLLVARAVRERIWQKRRLMSQLISMAWHHQDALVDFLGGRLSGLALRRMIVQVVAAAADRALDKEAMQAAMNALLLKVRTCVHAWMPPPPCPQPII